MVYTEYRFTQRQSTNWLWSEQEGIYSGETALALHDLSDVLPITLHMTLPASWTKRRLRIPEGLQLNFADVPKNIRSWVDTVPVTNPKQTIQDCIASHVQPDWIDQAIAQARSRGLLTQKSADRLIEQAQAKAGKIRGMRLGYAS